MDLFPGGGHSPQEDLGKRQRSRHKTHLGLRRVPDLGKWAKAVTRSSKPQDTRKKPQGIEVRLESGKFPEQAVEREKGLFLY